MFKKNKYVVIKQAISKDLAGFVANYFFGGRVTTAQARRRVRVPGRGFHRCPSGASLGLAERD